MLNSRRNLRSEAVSTNNLSIQRTQFTVVKSASGLSEIQKFIIVKLLLGRATRFDNLTDQIYAEKNLEIDESTPSSIASISRSVRRLEERELLIRLCHGNSSTQQAGLPVSSIPEQVKTLWIVPTVRGIAVGKDHWRRVNDDRYKVDFPSLSGSQS